MTTLTITDANVGVYENTITERIQIGEAAGRGVPMYFDRTQNLWFKADADASGKDGVKCITVTSGAINEWVEAAFGGDIDLGATLTVGETYVLSSDVGLIEPIGDLSGSDKVTILGTASAADKLQMNIVATGITKA